MTNKQNSKYLTSRDTIHFLYTKIYITSPTVWKSIPPKGGRSLSTRMYCSFPCRGGTCKQQEKLHFQRNLPTVPLLTSRGQYCTTHVDHQLRNSNRSGLPSQTRLLHRRGPSFIKYPNVDICILIRQSLQCFEKHVIRHLVA